MRRALFLGGLWFVALSGLGSASPEPVRLEVSYQAERRWNAEPSAVLEHVRKPDRLRELLPGLVRLEPMGDGMWLWETQTSVPLAPPQRNRFRVRLTVEGDSVAIWRSVDETEPDWLECRARLRREERGWVRLELDFRMRFIRPSLGSIHWLAPLVGEGFLRERVRERLVWMVETFLNRLEARIVG